MEDDLWGDFVLVVTAGAKFSASAICSVMILAMFLFVRLAGRPLDEEPPHNCSARGVTRSNFHIAEPQSVHTNRTAVGTYQRTKFRRLGHLAPGICAPLLIYNFDVAKPPGAFVGRRLLPTITWIVCDFLRSTRKRIL